MSAHAFNRGHALTFDVSTDTWLYDDTRTPVADDPDRPCGHCWRSNTAAGHDGCLGTLAGVMNACCGHGIAKEAYVQFPGGFSVSGRMALAVQWLWPRRATR